MDKIAVYLVDDHPAVREGVAAALQRSGRIEVIGQASDAYGLVEKLKRKEPDLLLLDVGLPDSSGIELVKQVKSDIPWIRVLMLSMYNRYDYILESLRGGASGYVSKETSPSRIVEAVERILEGEYFFDGVSLDVIVQNMLKQSCNVLEVDDDAYGSLTCREQEIMRLLAQGHPVRKIANTLFITTKTVENHRTSLFKKLSIENSAELVHYASRIGLIDI